MARWWSSWLVMSPRAGGEAWEGQRGPAARGVEAPGAELHADRAIIPAPLPDLADEIADRQGQSLPVLRLGPSDLSAFKSTQAQGSCKTSSSIRRAVR